MRRIDSDGLCCIDPLPMTARTLARLLRLFEMPARGSRVGGRVSEPLRESGVGGRVSELESGVACWLSEVTWFFSDPRLPTPDPRRNVSSGFASFPILSHTSAAVF